MIAVVVDELLDAWGVEVEAPGNERGAVLLGR